MTLHPVELLICVTCRAPMPDLTAGADAPRPGRALAESLKGMVPDGIALREVECLSNCSRGCTIALRAPGHWTYIYGNLDPALHLETVAEGAARYRDAPAGLVPWRERPEHFRKNCIARIPPMEVTND